MRFSSRGLDQLLRMEFARQLDEVLNGCVLSSRSPVVDEDLVNLQSDAGGVFVYVGRGWVVTSVLVFVRGLDLDHVGVVSRLFHLLGAGARKRHDADGLLGGLVDLSPTGSVPGLSRTEMLDDLTVLQHFEESFLGNGEIGVEIDWLPAATGASGEASHQAHDVGRAHAREEGQPRLPESRLPYEDDQQVLLHRPGFATHDRGGPPFDKRSSPYVG